MYTKEDSPLYEDGDGTVSVAFTARWNEDVVAESNEVVGTLYTILIQESTMRRVGFETTIAGDTLDTQSLCCGDSGEGCLEDDVNLSKESDATKALQTNAYALRRTDGSIDVRSTFHVRQTGDQVVAVVFCTSHSLDSVVDVKGTLS